MPVIVEINTAARTVYSKFTGAITDSGMRSAVVDLARHPGFDPAFSHIIDFSGVTAASLSPNFIKALAHEKPLFNRDATQVIVAPHPHMFALGRMAQILRERQLPNIRVVHSLAEALAIIGIKQTG
jgi:hypothetical protein